MRDASSAAESPAYLSYVQNITNDPAAENANAAPGLSEGTKIGGCYVLRRDVTKPGFRPVWVASDEVLGKEVTLHFVPPTVAADGRAMTELRQEVKRNRQLIHPNILRVYDFVEDGTHVAISMDEFEGQPLSEQLQRTGRMDPADLKPWIAQLAETLADAHRIQLFHRDLSPENIHLRPNGGLLISNFGISRVILNSLERGGLAKGPEAHLAYLSPQQIDGDRPSASDDIYGFGVLMYTLLAGTEPFSGDDIVPQIRKSVPEPIGTVRAAAGCTVPVPASWEKLIASCLEKNPEVRLRNLSEVLTLLGQDSGPARSEPAKIAVAAAAAPALGKKADRPAADPEPQRVALTPFPAVEKVANDPAGRVGDAAPPVEKSAASSKPLHPEMPPVGPRLPGKKPPVKGALSSNFPDLDRPRSKVPLVFLALAAAIIGVGIVMKSGSDTQDPEPEGAITRIDPGDDLSGNGAVQNTPDRNRASSPQTLPDPVPIQPTATVATVANVKTPEGELPTAKPPASGGIIGTEPPAKLPPPVIIPPANVVPDNLATASAAGEEKPPAGKLPAAVKATPTPRDTVTGSGPVTAAVSTLLTSSDGPPAVAAATPPPAKPSVVERTSVSDPAPTFQPLPTVPEPLQPLPKMTLPDKATTRQLAEIRQAREEAVEAIRAAAAKAEAAHQEASRQLETAKAGKEKVQKEYDTKRKTFAPVIQQSEALVAERRKLEDEAAKAITAAAEASKAAEAAKLKLQETIAKGGEKLEAAKLAETELSAATTQLSSATKRVDEISSVLGRAESIRQQARISQQQAEQDLSKIAAANEKARKIETEARRKANAEKISVLEKQVQDLKSEAARFDATIAPLKELGSAGEEAIRKIEEKKGEAQKRVEALQTEIKRLSSGAEDTAATPVTAATPPKIVTVAPVPETIENPLIPTPATTGPATNSLGMKFVPVGDVQFGVNLTTVKDFEAFASATSLKSEAWRNPGFKQAADHPVVNVTWREAEAFCKWLTDRERKGAQLKPGESYRLPTDLEWSKAVGLPAETGATPEERDMGVPDIYPWGNQWPPPSGAGNYAGEETQTEIPIPNYNDGFPNTSPVGKFQANAAGLHDMGGNVWQWVADSWNGENRAKTLRGGSWYNGAIPLSLLSSCRISSSPDTLHDTYGFRIVKAGESSKPRRR